MDTINRLTYCNHCYRPTIQKIVFAEKKAQSKAEYTRTCSICGMVFEGKIGQSQLTRLFLGVMETHELP